MIIILSFLQISYFFTSTLVYGLNRVNQCKCSASCSSRKLNMWPCVWSCSDPGIRMKLINIKPSDRKSLVSLMAAENGLHPKADWCFPHGHRHLKNLSMVLLSPWFLAFLDGGEEGVSRLNECIEKYFLLWLWRKLQSVMISCNVFSRFHFLWLYNHQRKSILLEFYIIDQQNVTQKLWSEWEKNENIYF